MSMKRAVLASTTKPTAACVLGLEGSVLESPRLQRTLNASSIFLQVRGEPRACGGSADYSKRLTTRRSAGHGLLGTYSVQVR